MPYDPNQVMGLTALSPTIAAYKQFMERQNNVGDSNIVPFLVSRGEPQLAGLIAKKLRVENAAKSQQQLAQQPPAAPPTVADQYDMAAQQQAMMAPGLPGMPNPAMDRASFAGGGIVAFADGGPFYVNAAGEVSTDPYSELWKAEAKRKQEAEIIKEIAAKKRAAEAAARAAAETKAAEASSAAVKGVGGMRPLSALGRLAGLAGLAAPVIEWAGSPEQQAKLGAATEMTMEDPLLAGWGVYDRSKTTGTLSPPKKEDLGVEFAGSADDLAMVRQLQALKKQYGANSPQVAAFEAAARSTRGTTTAPSAPSAGVELDKYLGLGATPEGRARKPAASTTAPAAAKAAPAPTPVDLYASYISEAEKAAKGEEAYTQEALDRYKKLGIGKAAEDLEKTLARLKSEYEGAGADRKNLKQSVIEASAKLMMGKGGFAEAFGEAVGTGVAGYYGRQKDMKKAALDLAKSTYELNQAKENLMLSAAKEGSAEYEKQRKRIEGLQDDQLKSQDSWNKLTYEQQQLNARLAAENAEANKRAELMYGSRETTAATAQFNAERTRLYNVVNAALKEMEAAAFNPTALAAAKQRYEDAMLALSNLQFGGTGGTGAGGTVSPEVQAIMDKYKN